MLLTLGPSAPEQLRDLVAEATEDQQMPPPLALGLKLAQLSQKVSGVGDVIVGRSPL